jgi:hypothetical protein
VAVSYLDATNQVHWADLCKAHPNMRFEDIRKIFNMRLEDLQDFLIEFYDQGGGAVEARYKWRLVWQGRPSVTEYLRVFMAAMANVMSIDDSQISEGEKVCNFYAGLRATMQHKCSYDPKSGSV